MEKQVLQDNSYELASIDRITFITFRETRNNRSSGNAFKLLAGGYWNTWAQGHFSVNQDDQAQFPLQTFTWYTNEWNWSDL